MRKILINILLAASTALVASPAMAQDSQEDSGQSEQARPERAQRAERPERAERPQRTERPQIMERAIAAARGSDNGQQPDRPQLPQQQYQAPQAPPQPQGEGRASGGERRSWVQRWSGGDANPATVERQQLDTGEFERGQVVPRGRDRREGRFDDGSIVGRAIEESRTGNPAPIVDRGGRGDGRDGRHRPRSTAGWSNDWRGDTNYDWRHYRDRHRSVFRLGNYWDPYGSNYRRFSIGFSLWPSYYQSNYWLDDPWMYRLPQTYGPYRWVRYYDDALLVNVYTGQVVDVVHSFFW